MRIWSEKPWYRVGGKWKRRVRARMPNGLWGYRRRLRRKQTPETRAKIGLAVAKALAKYKPRATAPEQAMAELLRARGVDFESQFRFRGSRYLFDFAVPSKRLLIEVDGCYWHGCARCGYPGTERSRRVDPLKNGLAAKMGWRLVRVKEHNLHTKT